MPDIRLNFILSGAGTNRHPGATVEFVIDDEKTASQLREQIKAQWPEAYVDVQIDKKKINIIHSAQVLDDSKPLKGYGLVNQDPPMTLHLMLQPLNMDVEPQKDTKVDKGCPCLIL